MLDTDNSNLPIGVFDSGVGGLTVLSALAHLLPNEDFLYLGDTARVPYGGRSPRIIQRYSLEIVEFLTQKKIKMLVIACNTSTAFAESLIKDRYPNLPIIGVIQPGVDALVKKTSTNKVGVVGTRSTIKSEEYTKRIINSNPNLQIFTNACPLLVPLVEEGWLEEEVTSMVIKKYFNEFIEKGVGCVVLGCTHYPLLKKIINKIYPNLELIDSSEETAEIVKKLLIKNKLSTIERNQNETRNIQLYFTDMSNPQNNMEKFLSGVPNYSIEEVNL